MHAGSACCIGQGNVEKAWQCARAPASPRRRLTSAACRSRTQRTLPAALPALRRVFPKLTAWCGASPPAGSAATGGGTRWEPTAAGDGRGVVRGLHKLGRQRWPARWGRRLQPLVSILDTWRNEEGGSY